MQRVKYVLLFMFYPIKKIKKQKSKYKSTYIKKSLEDCPSLMVKDRDDKWKNWRTKMYKIYKIDRSILSDKKLHWWKYFYPG